MLDNISKMTKENVEAFVTGLQNGDTQRQISESIGISEATLSIWKRRALADEPLSGNDLLLQPLRDFFGRKDEELGHREMRAALVKAITTDRVTTIEKVTEIVKLTSSQRETLGEDLSSAFDAGDARVGAESNDDEDGEPRSDRSHQSTIKFCFQKMKVVLVTRIAVG